MEVRALVISIALLFFSACSDQVDAPVVPDEALQEDRPFYQTLETPPAPILMPDEALETFVIAPGFRIELAAAEPLIEDPVAADWDEDSRLYVAEMRAYMPDVDGTGEEEPIGAVARLTDTDGDGRFDEREVVLDGLVLPRALRIVNDGLLVAEMGKLWLCPSASGWSRDIDCGARQFLGVYGEHQGSVEHAENGLLVGLDNWIYSAKSARRLQLVDGELREEPTSFRGQWGITQDDLGRLFYNTNSNLLLGDYYDAQAVVAAGNPGAPGLNTRISPANEVFSVRVNPGVNRAYLPGVLREDGRLRNATSASGMVVHRGDALGSKAPDVFVAEPAANLVVAFALREAGVGIVADQQLYPDERWGQRDFLASTDERFRPVDVMNGPDGALYVIDFYRGVIQDHIYLSDELKAQVLERGLDRPLGMGRIWRVVSDGVDGASALPAWRTLDAGALIEQLSAPDIWRRATAQRLLLRSKAGDVDERLASLVRQGDLRAAVHGLWTLAGRGGLSAGVVQAALAREGVLGEAALLAGGHLLKADDLLALMTNVEPASRTYLYVLAALRHQIDEDNVLAAVRGALLAHLDDVHVRSFVQAAVRGREVDLVRQLIEGEVWTGEREAATGYLALLAQQYLRAEGPGATPMLDLIGSQPEQDIWVQQALLRGLFETTREPGFVRVLLEAPHALFDTDVEALWPSVSRARRAFTWPGDTLAADAKPLTPRQAALMVEGEKFYASSCANCHGADGAGVGDLGPPLADSPWVTEAPERLARIVLHGLQGPIEVAGRTWNSAMPGHQDFPGFDDEVASGLLTYLRRSWGHAGRAIDPEFVTQIRQAAAGRAALWTVTELETIDINTHFTKYTGGFGRPDAPTVFSYDGTDLSVNAGIFSGPLKELKEDHFLYEPRQIRFEFVVADDGSVPAVLIPADDGTHRTVPRVPDG